MRLAPVPVGQPRWPAGAFPDHLATATARLRRNVEDRVGPDGALRDPCRSRVLESALLLALLDRTRLEPAARNRLAAYLSAHRDTPEPLDRLLAQAALDGRPQEAHLLDMDQFLDQAPAFTGPRKRALLQAVLVLLGAAPTGTMPGPEAFPASALHAWARVQVTAVKAVLAHAHGLPHLVEHRDLDLLRSTQRPGSVWEGNILIHVSVLHALARFPGHHRIVAAGVRTALKHQRPDGGVPFIRDEDTWVTATAGIALHTAGVCAPVVNAVARRLMDLQQPAGGWSYSEGVELADVDCTSVATEVLHLTGPDTHRVPVARAIAALHALRGPDGGFPTYLAGAPSEAGMTAAAINALATQGPRQQDTVARALTFLASQQRADGSFPPDWSRSRLHTVFRAALAASGGSTTPGTAVRRITERALRLVQESQNADGGWGHRDGTPSDALSTAYALTTLAAVGTRDAVCHAARGAAYLLSQQRPDGSIASIPDSIGPRPFGFTVPVLADVFSLLALGHLARRVQPEPTISRESREPPHNAWRPAAPGPAPEQAASV
ncbi:prenyltransferase/squalene oxidase repeat-containing protein [Kitasatospora sp. NPDC087314]|uniref:prenyltransferase/squalene oxidase repeat-containing protein n=1 Tax=Kitasatospora sp. NPDC087314 TaxID=3364068 RepID=UPI0038287996